MNAPEAMQLLIYHMDRMWIHSDYQLSLDEEQKEQIKLATAVCVAMLNTALPVSRFRGFVEVINKFGKKKIGQLGTVDAEYTVCAVNVAGVRSGLAGLDREDMEIRALIFEQKQAGADVVSGFHGMTKSQKFRDWYKSLDEIEAATPTVQ